MPDHGLAHRRRLGGHPRLMSPSGIRHGARDCCRRRWMAEQVIDAADAAQSESAKLLMSRIVDMYTSGIATRSRQSPAWHVPLTVRLATETPASASLR